MPRTRPMSDDPDDIFAETRMSFGDHIEELRHRLFKALKGLAFFLSIGFLLDGVGYYMGTSNFGIGRPVFNLMTSTVEEQVRDYYHHRNDEQKPILDKIERISPEDLARITRRLDEHDNDLTSLSPEDRAKLLGKLEAMPAFIAVEPLEKYF